MENKLLDMYVKPQMEILELELLQMVAASTSLEYGGPETDGDAESNCYRRGSWGNLWE